MTLGNMRELGVRSLDVSCWNCHHQAVLSADRWPTSRCRRSAELEGAAAAGDADRRAVAKLRTGYRIVITNPLRSAATISPVWKPDSVSTAPF
jgi:hypothetical protein